MWPDGKLWQPADAHEPNTSPWFTVNAFHDDVLWHAAQLLVEAICEPLLPRAKVPVWHVKQFVIVVCR